MVCSAIVPFRWSLPVMGSAILDKVMFSLLILVCSAGALLKSDVHLPIITKLVSPILAEREKTFQLERIIRWWKSSDYTQYRLVLSQSAENPTGSNNAVNRQYRAPTHQQYLDLYTRALVPLRNENTIGQLLVCFGDQKIAGSDLLYAVPGMYSGSAVICIQRK